MGSCSFAEDISLLVDGALSNQEAAQVRSHIAVCPECRATMDQFLLLRDSLKGYAVRADEVSQRRVLNTILSSGRGSLWKRRLSVPAPALALLVMSLIGLGVWSFLMRGPATGAREPATAVTSAQSAAGGESGQRSSTEVGIELSRLDHGGRAVIVKVRKNQRPDERAPGRTVHED